MTKCATWWNISTWVGSGSIYYYFVWEHVWRPGRARLGRRGFGTEKRTRVQDRNKDHSLTPSHSSELMVNQCIVLGSKINLVPCAWRSHFAVVLGGSPVVFVLVADESCCWSSGRRRCGLANEWLSVLFSMHQNSQPSRRKLLLTLCRRRSR